MIDIAQCAGVTSKIYRWSSSSFLLLLPQSMGRWVVTFMGEIMHMQLNHPGIHLYEIKHAA